MEYRDGEMKNGFSSLTEITENTEGKLRLVLVYRRDASLLRFFFTIKELRFIKVLIIDELAVNKIYFYLEHGLILTPSPSPKERGDGAVEISAKWVVFM
jgi:hypothetical protein